MSVREQITSYYLYKLEAQYEEGIKKKTCALSTT